MTLSACPLPGRQVDQADVFRCSLADIERADWERLVDATPSATPFSSWTFQRAWWDAYGPTAEEHYLVIAAQPERDRADASRTRGGTAGADAGLVRAIVPLMLRSTAAPGSEVPTATADAGAGPLDGVAARARRSFYFAASYHADYATVLAPPEALPLAASATARHLVQQLQAGAGDLVDLRRIKAGDPLLEHLPPALSDQGAAAGFRVRVEPEDFCPILPLAGDWHEQLAAMDKKTRHEVRRKLRRAESHGPVSLRYLPLDQASADRFIRLHQARWGSDGLFADGADGDRSRTFLRRLAELEALEGPRARFHLGEVSIGDRVVYVLAGFSDRGTCYFYNAGLEPGSLELSPGIVGTAAYLRDRIGRADRDFDFLRGDEPYKYHWGAQDRSILRLVFEPAGTYGDRGMPG